MIVTAAWAGRRYGVFGLARTGRAAVAALRESGAEVWPWDDAEGARAGIEGCVDLNSADLSPLGALMVSPGVPLNAHPLAARAAAAGVAVIGDIELFAEALHAQPGARVVAITGTNGKSTTAALLHHIVAAAGVPARLGGNIGAPVLSERPLEQGGVYVLELSSFQIDLTFTLAAEVAVLTNITPDHLDRYADFNAYAASKERLFEMQREGGVAVIAVDDEHTRAVAARVAAAGVARVVEVSGERALDRGVSVAGGYASIDGDAFARQRDWPALAGAHNGQNAAAAIAAARELGIPVDVIRAALVSYPGLPHRMEPLREVAGVRWINDSKATNAASAAPALAAHGAVHWIAGGIAKGDSLGEIEPMLGNVRAAYLIGEAAPLFARLLKGRVPVVEAGTLEVAVARAAAAARPGETVLLAPACASFDQFRDYADRGDQFRALVAAL